MLRITTPKRHATCIAERVGRQRDAHPPDSPNPAPLAADIQQMLAGLPDHLWARGPYDMGHTLQHKVVVKTKPDTTPVWVAQYPGRPEAEEGITATIAGLKEAGVLVPSHSP